MKVSDLLFVNVRLSYSAPSSSTVSLHWLKAPEWIQFKSRGSSVLSYRRVTATLTPGLYSVSHKNPPLRFSEFFPKRLGIFNQFFTHLLCNHFYTRIQIFIQISPTLTKLCHTKHDHQRIFTFYKSFNL